MHTTTNITPFKTYNDKVLVAQGQVPMYEGMPVEEFTIGAFIPTDEDHLVVQRLWEVESYVFRRFNPHNAKLLVYLRSPNWDCVVMGGMAEMPVLGHLYMATMGIVYAETPVSYSHAVTTMEKTYENVVNMTQVSRKIAIPEVSPQHLFAPSIWKATLPLLAVVVSKDLGAKFFNKLGFSQELVKGGVKTTVDHDVTSEFAKVLKPTLDGNALLSGYLGELNGVGFYTNFFNPEVETQLEDNTILLVGYLNTLKVEVKP